MEKILQGSNEPLLLETDEEAIKELTSFSAALVDRDTILKIWTLEDITIQENILILPLKESETLALNNGLVTLDIKGLNKNGTIIFMELVDFHVIHRANKTVLTGE